jgi:hypothetical protein
MKPVFATIFPDTNVDVIESTCGKVKYHSFRDAQEAINNGKKHRRFINGKRVNRRVGKKDIRPVRSYKCDDCGFWHLTSQPDFNE